MGYTIRYTGTREQQRLAGFRDAMDYVGEARQERVLQFVTGVLSDAKLTGRQKVTTIRLGLSFAGLQGVPAWAVMKTLAIARRLSKEAV